MQNETIQADKAANVRELRINLNYIKLERQLMVKSHSKKALKADKDNRDYFRFLGDEMRRLKSQIKRLEKI